MTTKATEMCAHCGAPYGDHTKTPKRKSRRCPDDRRDFRSTRVPRIAANSFDENEVALLAFMVSGVQVIGKDLSAVSRHKSFPALAAKVARMKKRVTK